MRVVYTILLLLTACPGLKKAWRLGKLPPERRSSAEIAGICLITAVSYLLIVGMLWTDTLV